MSDTADDIPASAEELGPIEELLLKIFQAADDQGFAGLPRDLIEIIYAIFLGFAHCPQDDEKAEEECARKILKALEQLDN